MSSEQGLHRSVFSSLHLNLIVLCFRSSPGGEMLIIWDTQLKSQCSAEPCLSAKGSDKLQGLCRTPEYGIRIGPKHPGGCQGALQQLQGLLPADDELRLSDYLPAHFIHIPRGLQEVLSLPQFHVGQLQVLAFCLHRPACANCSCAGARASHTRHPLQCDLTSNRESAHSPAGQVMLFGLQAGCIVMRSHQNVWIGFSSKVKL